MKNLKYHAALGNVIKREREFLGLDREELSRACGLGISTISKIERAGEGTGGVYVDTIIAIADGLDLPTSALFEAAERSLGSS